MNITELKALADQCICHPASRGIADIEAAGEGLKFLASNLEDAQGEIRALRATEARLVERVKELEEGLSWYAENARLCRLISSEGDAGRIALDSDGGAKARALLEKKE